MGRMIVHSGHGVESTGYGSFGLQVFARSWLTVCPASG